MSARGPESILDVGRGVRVDVLERLEALSAARAATADAQTVVERVAARERASVVGSGRVGTSASLAQKVEPEVVAAWRAAQDAQTLAQEAVAEVLREAGVAVVRDEPLDLAGVAAWSGLSLDTLRTYRRDGYLPEADGAFGQVQWWYVSTVRRWWEGRRPRSPRPV